MTRTFRVGLLGYGLAGRVFHAPLIGHIRGLALACVVSSRAREVHAHLPDVAVTPDADAVLRDPSIDLAVIATPNATHFDLAIRALRAGKHVVVDKPFTVTSGEAQALMQEARGRGLLLSVFHNRRWDADFLTLRRLIQEGALGDVLFFESHFDRFRPLVSDRWRERAEPGGGTWYDLGAHLVDQALVLFGLPDAVHADLLTQREGAAATDYFHVVLRYGRCRVILHGSSLAPENSRRFTVHGTRGSFTKDGLDPQEEALRAGRPPAGPDWGTDPVDGVLTRVSGSSVERHAVTCERGDYIRYYAAMRDAMLGQGGVPVTAEEGATVIGILETAEKSAALRREIPFGDGKGGAKPV